MVLPSEEEIRLYNIIQNGTESEQEQARKDLEEFLKKRREEEKKKSATLGGYNRVLDGTYSCRCFFDVAYL